MPTTTGCLTNAAEQFILDWLVNGQAMTVPTSARLALWAGSPTDTGAGGAEVTGAGTNGYARIAAAGIFAAAASRAVASNVDAVFGPSTGGPWSGVTHWALMSDVTGGAMWAYGDITDGTVGTDDSYKIPSGSITLTFTAGSKWTDAVLNAILDHLVGNADNSAAVPTWLALYDGDPLGAGAEAHTAGAAGYARVDLDGVMSAASGGSIENGSTATFGPASGAAWGNVDYFAVMDASTAGNVRGGAALTAAKTVNDGDSAEFAAAALVFTLD